MSNQKDEYKKDRNAHRRSQGITGVFKISSNTVVKELNELI